MSQTNKALAGAERKGAAARAAGVPRDANPYPDRRTWRGSVTFSRAFRTAWRDGWDAAGPNDATGADDAPAEARG